MTISINKIKTELDLKQCLEISAKAFCEKCPIFLLEKIPPNDFISYYSSIKTVIFKSPFAYGLSFQNEIKAAFICIPVKYSHKHITPASMKFYDDFFSSKFEENKRFFDLNKCVYGLFLGSEFPGAGKILYTKIFEDMDKLGYDQMYWEMSNPINTKTLNKFQSDPNLKIQLIHQAMYREKINVDFFLTSHKKNLII